MLAVGEHPDGRGVGAGRQIAVDLLQVLRVGFGTPGTFCDRPLEAVPAFRLLRWSCPGTRRLGSIGRGLERAVHQVAVMANAAKGAK